MVSHNKNHYGGSIIMKKFVLTLGTAVLALGVLTACGDAEETPVEDDVMEEAPAEEAELEEAPAEEEAELELEEPAEDDADLEEEEEEEEA